MKAFSALPTIDSVMAIGSSKYSCIFKTTASVIFWSNPDENSAKPTVTVRELKFHLHDSAKRKTSVSFGKIKEATVLKITFYLIIQ